MILRAPTLDEPCTSEPCQVSDVGSYQLDFKAESKHSLDSVAENLGTLLNGFVYVDVCIAGSVVAHARLDLLPVAQGSASVQARLNLIPNQESSGSLKSNANITLAAHLTQDNEDAFPDNPAQGANEPPNQLGRVPFHFLGDQEVSNSTVASISCLPATNLPPAFLTAACSAIGGLTICMGLSWQSESSASGFFSSVGLCDGQEFQKHQHCRTLLRRDDFLSLQDAAASCGKFYVEIARSVAVLPG